MTQLTTEAAHCTRKLTSLFQRKTDGDHRPAGQALSIFGVRTEFGTPDSRTGRLCKQTMAAFQHFDIPYYPLAIKRDPELDQPGNAGSTGLKRIGRTDETRERRAAGSAEGNIPHRRSIARSPLRGSRVLPLSRFPGVTGREFGAFSSTRCLPGRNLRFPCLSGSAKITGRNFSPLFFFQQLWSFRLLRYCLALRGFCRAYRFRLTSAPPFRPERRKQRERERSGTACTPICGKTEKKARRQKNMQDKRKRSRHSWREDFSFCLSVEFHFHQ